MICQDIAKIDKNTKMADVLLINPQTEMGRKFKKKRIVCTPLGILSIGTYLQKRGYSVKLINTMVEEDFMKQILQEASTAKIIGFTVMTAQVPHALMLSKKLKKFNKPIVWGGIHPDLFKEQTCKHPAVDIVVYREGEETTYQLIKCLEKKGDLKEVLGIAYKKEGKVIINPPQPLIEINKLISDPHYDLLNLKAKFSKVRSLEVETSRGCPYRCTFCMNTIGWKHNWRALSAETILNLLKKLKEKYNVEIIKFREEDFFVNKQRVKDVVDGLLKRDINIKWITNARANYFKDDYINDGFMAKMKKSGLDALYIGVESGSERLREFMKKDITEEQIYRAVELCAKYNVTCNINLMIGYPTETKKDIFDTINMMNKIIKINKNAVLNGPVVFRPYAGSSVYDYCINKGLKEPQDLEEWAKSIDFSAYVPVKDFPWIEKGTYQYVANLGKYGTLALRPFSKIWEISHILAILSLLCKLRWKLRFFRFPIDFALYKSVTKRVPLY